MEHRHDHFKGRAVFLGMLLNRYSATIVLNGDAVVLIYKNFYAVAMASKGLINAIVNYFVYKVVETSVPHIPNVHGRSLPDCLQTFQDLDVFSGVTLSVWHTFTHKFF